MGSKRIAADDQEANVMLDERFQELLEVPVQIHVPTRDVPDEVLRRRRCALRWVASASNATAHRDHRSPSSSRLARPMSWTQATGHDSDRTDSIPTRPSLHHDPGSCTPPRLRIGVNPRTQDSRGISPGLYNRIQPSRTMIRPRRKRPVRRPNQRHAMQPPLTPQCQARGS